MNTSINFHFPRDEATKIRVRARSEPYSAGRPENGVYLSLDIGESVVTIHCPNHAYAKIVVAELNRIADMADEADKLFA